MDAHTEDIQVCVGHDNLGDGYVNLQFSAPAIEGLSADDVERIAMLLLSAAAASRVRGAMFRQMTLDGHQGDVAYAYISHLLGEHHP